MLFFFHSGISWTPKKWPGSQLLQGDVWLLESDGIVSVAKVRGLAVTVINIVHNLHSFE